MGRFFIPRSAWPDEFGSLISYRFAQRLNLQRELHCSCLRTKFWASSETKKFRLLRSVPTTRRFGPEAPDPLFGKLRPAAMFAKPTPRESTTATAAGQGPRQSVRSI